MAPKPKDDATTDDSAVAAKSDANESGKQTFTASQLKIGQEPTPHLNAIARTGSGALFIVGERGAAFRSRDSGATWQRLQLPYDGSMFGVIGYAADHVLAFGLRGPFGHVGVSIAVAGSSFVQMALLLVFLLPKLHKTHAGEIGGSVARTAGASFVAVAVAYSLARFVQGMSLPRALPGIAGFACFGLVFAVAAHLLRSPELGALTGALRRRLHRK